MNLYLIIRNYYFITLVISINNIEAEYFTLFIQHIIFNYAEDYEKNLKNFNSIYLIF